MNRAKSTRRVKLLLADMATPYGQAFAFAFLQCATANNRPCSVAGKDSTRCLDLIIQVDDPSEPRKPGKEQLPRRMKIGLYVFQRHGGKVVFIGRFIAVLRTYAAFLAGTNRMSWPRFLVFNAAGGVTWACAIGFAYYYIGTALKNVRGPLDIVLGVIAVLIVVAFLIYLHKAEDRFAARAEEASPGELADF